MNTPREILLRRHAATTQQLDRIRSRIVTGLDRQSATASSGQPRWAELFWSVRGHLAALAGAWVVIALFNLQNMNDRPVLAASPGGSAPGELLLIARENRLQMRELLGALDTSAGETAAPASRPRSRPQPGAMWSVATDANC